MANRRRYIIYAFLFFLLAINYMDRSVLSVAAQPIAKEFHLSVGSLGVVFSVFSWTYLVCLLPAGYLIDRLGSRRVLVVSIALWSLATLLTGFAGSVGFLIVTRLVMGVGESAGYPGAGRVSLDWFPDRERGVSTAFYNAGSAFGTAAGSLLTVGLISILNWHAAFFVAGGLGFVWLLLWLLLYNKPERVWWLGSRERDMILSERRAPVTAEVPAERPGLGDLGRMLVSSPTLLILAVVQGSTVYVSYMFLTFLPTYLETAHHLSVAQGGIESAIPPVGQILGGVVVGLLSDRLMRSRVLAAGYRRYVVVVALIVGAAGLLLSPFVANIVLALTLITIASVLVGAANSQIQVVTFDMLGDHRLVAQSQAVIPIGGNAFGLLAPIVTGFVVQATGSFVPAFAIGAGLLLVGAILVIAIVRAPIGREVALAS